MDPIGARWRRARGRLLAVSVALLTLGSAGVGVWTARVVRLHGEVQRYSAWWSVPRGDPGGLTYVALGDSAAQGIGASRVERGYVGLLAERLRAETGRPVRVVNLSVSGARIADVLASQLPRLAGLRPDIVTVDIGGNDVPLTDLAGFTRDAEALCVALPPGTVVANVPYFMHGRWERKATAFSAVLTAAAHRHGLAVAPLHDAMRARGWRAMVTDYAADWFHPNDRGHRVWAEAFWPAVRAARESRLRSTT